MRKVEIKIYDKQIYPTHSDESRNIFYGDRALKDSNNYIIYREKNLGITTTIKFTQEKVEVKRMGAVHGQLRFELGKLTQSMYNTPYGTLPIEIDTKKCKVHEYNEAVEIDIRYTIHMGNEVVSDNILQITAKYII